MVVKWKLQQQDTVESNSFLTELSLLKDNTFKLVYWKVAIRKEVADA